MSAPRGGVMRLSILGPRDGYGRCDFDLEWAGHRMDGAYGLCAQCFRAEPEKHIADLEWRGWLVEIVEADREPDLARLTP